MGNSQTDEVNVIREYKKIYDECEVQDKIKILGNIQKHQIDMLKIKTMLQLEQIRDNAKNYIQTEINDKGEVVETRQKQPSKLLWILADVGSGLVWWLCGGFVKSIIVETSYLV